MKKIITILIFISLFYLVQAQEAKIKISHIGFGETTEVAYFTVHNSGDVPITDVTVYIDGNLTQTITGKSSPGKGFEITLYLKPGGHLIEVKTPEGASDSLEISVPGTKEERPSIIEKVKSSIDEIKILAVIALILVVTIILWLLLRKQKIKI